jgi:hypothetical protein
MALINCIECNQEVSSKAEKCPHCGVKLKKSGGWCLPIIVGGIVLLIIFYIIGSNSESGGIITDEQTYSQSWRSPYGSEYSEIGKIIVQNGIKVCGEYYVKEIESTEFVIACSADGTTWDYFVVYTSLDKIYRANDEMESKLYPPR